MKALEGPFGPSENIVKIFIVHSNDVKIEEPYWPLLLAAAGEKFPLWRR